MADDETKRLQARLTGIQARLKTLSDGDDSASWGRATAVRGGFRQERADLTAEAERLDAQLRESSPGP